MNNLLQKIKEKTALIGIIGLGHTGLSLAHDFAQAGFQVIGYDIDQSKIKHLKKKKAISRFLFLICKIC